MFFEKFKLDREIVFERKTGTFLEHELHFHDILELHVLKENKAYFQLANRNFEGKPGDVFLFRPFEPHWNLIRDPNKPIQWVSILFTPSVVRFIPQGFKLLAPFYAVEAVSPYIPADSVQAQEIQYLASLAVEEEREKKVGWESKQFLYFIDILVNILRYSMEHSCLQTGEDLDSGIIKAIEYFLNHFSEDMDLEYVVNLTGKQRTYFYKHFKKITGLTPNQFIHKLRMQMAVYLLQHTDRSITEIAYDCGYKSVEFFNKHFRQSEGVAPREYRKSIKNNRTLGEEA